MYSKVRGMQAVGMLWMSDIMISRLADLVCVIGHACQIMRSVALVIGMLDYLFTLDVCVVDALYPHV